MRSGISSTRLLGSKKTRKVRSGISSTRLLESKKKRRLDPASRQLDFLGPRRQEGEIRHLVTSTSWVQEDRKARSGISSFLSPRRQEGEIRHLVTSTSWVQEDRKARTGISSNRLLESNKMRRRDPASRQLDFLTPRRQEGEIRHLVTSTSWVQEDRKARSGISSPRLLVSKKTGRRDPASRHLDFLVPRRQEGEIRHLVTSTSCPRRQEGEIRHLVTSTSWVQEDKKARSGISSTSTSWVQEEKKVEIRHLVTSTSWVQEDKKARSGISSPRLLGSKKTRRRDPASRHLDFLGPRRQEGEIRHLVNSTSWVQEDKKARSGISSTSTSWLQEDKKARFGISSTRLLGSKKTRRRDSASRHLDFLVPRRQEGEIRHLVTSTSWDQEDKKVRSGISSPRLLGSKNTGRRDPASHQLDFLSPRRQEGIIRHYGHGDFLVI